MPKSRFDKYAQPPGDPLKALVLGRKGERKMSSQELADKTNMSKTRYNDLMKKGSSWWRVSDIQAFSRALDIPMDELRACVGR